MTDYYDARETREPGEREAQLFSRLPDVLRSAMAAPAHAESLKDVDPAGVTSRAALARLPVLRKSVLGALQKAKPPMGGLLGVPMSQIRHVFMSPGPIFEVDTDEKDFFR